MRVVNPYKVRLVTSGTTIEDKQIVIPVGETFDGIGQNQQVEDYVEKLADESVNPIVDYEKWRYIPLSGENSNVTTDLGYDFYFYGTPTWVDYNLTDNTNLNASVDFSGSTQPYTDIAAYTTQPPFVYPLVKNEFTFTFNGFHLDVLDSNNGWSSSYVDTQFLKEANINIIAFFNNIQLAVSSVVINVTPNGNSFIESSVTIPGGVFNRWRRNFNVSVSFTLMTGVTTPNPSNGTFTLKCKSNDPSVGGGIDGYSLKYKAESREVTDDYYTDYTTSKIPSLNIDNDFKGYTNSFFRLDYYDSVIEESQNLLFTDVLTVSEGKQFKAEFSTKLNKQNYFLYWLKNDPVIEEQGYRDVYMSARFFNASTGLIHQFFNTDEKIPTIDLYETKYRYTKVRLYKDYTYVIEDRTIIEANLLGNISWTVTETLSPGTTQLKLYEIRTK